MDAETIAAFSGWAAAVVAATFAGLQFYVGRKQAEAALTSSRAALINACKALGRHTVAEFRQKWIDNVIDTLCELYSITATTRDHAPGEQASSIVAARTKLGILLNPDEADTIELFENIDAIISEDVGTKANTKSVLMLAIARRLLKREWVRMYKEEAEIGLTQQMRGALNHSSGQRLNSSKGYYVTPLVTPSRLRRRS